MDKTTIIPKDPTDLAIHPLAKLAPEWAKNDDRFIALVEDMRERGLDYELLIDCEGRIADGRQRWRAAKQLGWREVPCREVGETEVVSVILNSLVHRRHLTSGALAYVAYPLFQHAFDSSRRRRLENLKNPNISRTSAERTIGKSVQEFAESLGFGRTLFFQAQEVHAAFAKTPALKAEFEPKILSGDIGLGACLAGIAGKLATDGKAKLVAEQLELFQSAFDTLKTRFSYWRKFDDKQKAAMRPILREAVAEMPADLRDELSKALKEAK